MKKLLLTLVVALFAVTLKAAPPKGWFTDFDKAVAAAKAEKKDIYVLFTGSDWCGYCIKLRKDVLEKGAFKKFAEKKLILLYCDFPRREKIPAEQMRKQQALARKLGAGGGVPSAIIIDADGNVKGKIGGYSKLVPYMKRLKDIVK